jgi:glycosyltransferase involved in cell wall biosynthesis
MTYLEAMASGCAVLSYDGPTMNEYIQHGDNGFLFKPKSKIGQYRRWAMRRVRQRWIDKGLPDIFHFSYELSDAQDWDAL